MVLAVCASPAVAQAPSGSSSSSTGTQVQAPSSAPAPAYITIDPLARVRYDNKYDVSLELAYQHIKAGPNLLQGANLGGLNLSASYWLTRRWALEGTGRAFFGTSGATPNAFIGAHGPESIQGPFVAEYVFAAGPEWLGPHNKHGALTAHVLGGGVYGRFEQDLRHQSPALVGFYNNQVAPAVVMGGHIDLNRSERWAFRLSPDALLTHFGVNYGNKATQFDINAAFSVGVEYKFLRKR